MAGASARLFCSGTLLLGGLAGIVELLGSSSAVACGSRAQDDVGIEALELDADRRVLDDEDCFLPMEKTPAEACPTLADKDRGPAEAGRATRRGREGALALAPSDEGALASGIAFPEPFSFSVAGPSWLVALAAAVPVFLAVAAPVARGHISAGLGLLPLQLVLLDRVGPADFGRAGFCLGTGVLVGARFDCTVDVLVAVLDPELFGADELGSASALDSDLSDGWEPAEPALLAEAGLLGAAFP